MAIKCCELGKQNQPLDWIWGLPYFQTNPSFAWVRAAEPTTMPLQGALEPGRQRFQSIQCASRWLNRLNPQVVNPMSQTRRPSISDGLYHLTGNIWICYWLDHSFLPGAWPAMDNCQDKISAILPFWIVTYRLVMGPQVQEERSWRLTYLHTRPSESSTTRAAGSWRPATGISWVQRHKPIGHQLNRALQKHKSIKKQ